MRFLFMVVGGIITTTLIGVVYYKRLPKAFKLVLCQVILALICESLAKYLIVSHSYRYNNLWIFNIYLLGEIWLNGIAGRMLINNKTIKKVIPFLLAGLTVLWSINIYVESMASFANWCFIATSIVLIFIYFAVLFDLALFKNQRIVNQPAFWLSLSILLFFGCDLPYFGLRNYLIGHQLNGIEHRLHTINTILSLIRYPLIAISFILCGYGRKQKGSIKIA